MKNCLKYYTEFREKYECERGSTKHGAMANILICLEKAIQNGNDYHIDYVNYLFLKMFMTLQE